MEGMLYCAKYVIRPYSNVVSTAIYIFNQKLSILFLISMSAEIIDFIYKSQYNCNRNKQLQFFFALISSTREYIIGSRQLIERTNNQ